MPEREGRAMSAATYVTGTYQNTHFSVAFANLSFFKDSHERNYGASGAIHANIYFLSQAL